MISMMVSLAVLLVSIFLGASYGQVGRDYHVRDAQGNFQVAYTASDGHYLVEDRTADGTAHLGNFGYRSTGGENVGVAYGTDGAGFVISAPGVSTGGGYAGYPSGGSSYGGGGYQQPVAPSSYRTHSYNQPVYNSYDYTRYQVNDYPTSNQASSGAQVTTPSYLPAYDLSSTYTPSPSTTFSQPSSDASNFGQSHSYNSIAASVAASAAPPVSSFTATFTHPPPTPPQPVTPPTTTTSTDFYSHLPMSVARAPFSYSFNSYNDPWRTQWPPALPGTSSASAAAPQRLSYQTPSLATSASASAAIDQVAASLRQQQQQQQQQQLSALTTPSLPSLTSSQLRLPGRSSAYNYAYSTQYQWGVPYSSWSTPYPFQAIYYR